MPWVLLIGLAFWLFGTVLVRLAGHHYLPRQPGPGWVLLYVVSLLGMALIARAVYGWSGLPSREWLSAAAVLALPTLVLDAFTSLFFARVFPRMNAGASGAFGGWMLICSAGAVLGAMLPR